MISALLVSAGNLLVLLFHKLLCRFTLVKVVIWRYEFVPFTTSLIATLFLFPLQHTHTLIDTDKPRSKLSASPIAFILAAFVRFGARISALL